MGCCDYLPPHPHPLSSFVALQRFFERATNFEIHLVDTKKSSPSLTHVLLPFCNSLFEIKIICRLHGQRNIEFHILAYQVPFFALSRFYRGYLGQLFVMFCFCSKSLSIVSLKSSRDVQEMKAIIEPLTCRLYSLKRTIRY